MKEADTVETSEDGMYFKKMMSEKNWERHDYKENEEEVQVAENKTAFSYSNEENIPQFIFRALENVLLNFINQQFFYDFCLKLSCVNIKTHWVKPYFENQYISFYTSTHIDMHKGWVRFYLPNAHISTHTQNAQSYTRIRTHPHTRTATHVRTHIFFVWHINIHGLFDAKIILEERRLLYCFTHGWWVGEG